MGEAADDILAGAVCQCCGEWTDATLNGEPNPGHPVTCKWCQPGPLHLCDRKPGWWPT